MPIKMVCPDRDSFVDEHDQPRSFNGNAFFLDLKTIGTFAGNSVFDHVDAMHVFGVGRLLLDASLPMDVRPKLPPNWSKKAPGEMYMLQNRMYRECLKEFVKVHSEQPDSLAGQMLHLIRSCCHPETNQRPTLANVKQKLEEFTRSPLVKKTTVVDRIARLALLLKPK